MGAGRREGLSFPASSLLGRGLAWLGPSDESHWWSPTAMTISGFPSLLLPGPVRARVATRAPLLLVPRCLMPPN